MGLGFFVCDVGFHITVTCLYSLLLLQSSVILCVALRCNHHTTLSWWFHLCLQLYAFVLLVPQGTKCYNCFISTNQVASVHRVASSSSSCCCCHGDAGARCDSRMYVLQRCLSVVRCVASTMLQPRR